MADFENKQSMDAPQFEWTVKEYQQHERTKRWYLIAAGVALVFMVFSLVTANFLFAVIILLAGFIIYLQDKHEPLDVHVAIGKEGIAVGRKFYEYDEIKDFALLHKPHRELSRLYLEFKSVMSHRLSLPLPEGDPLPIRKFLLQYLPEDKERTDEPLSEFLGRLFRL